MTSFLDGEFIANTYFLYYKYFLCILKSHLRTHVSNSDNVLSLDDFLTYIMQMCCKDWKNVCVCVFVLNYFFPCCSIIYFWQNFNVKIILSL